MDLQRCINGHFYDADAFAFCPHCPSEGSQINNGYMDNFGDVQTESIDFSNNLTMEDDSAIDKTVKLTDLIDSEGNSLNNRWDFTHHKLTIEKHNNG